MKKRTLVTLVALVSLATACALTSCGNGDGVMSKNKGVYTVDTTTLATDINGFNGPTPLKITIKDKKIVSVEALENSETPSFFERMVNGGMLSKWEGMTVDKALESLIGNVDVVSGATFSSKAVAENLARGLKYYQEHTK